MSINLPPWNERMNRRSFFFLVLMVTLSLGCRDPDRKDAASSFLLDRDQRQALRAVHIRQGKELYEHYCLLCHGEEGKGDGYNAATLEVTPKDLTDRPFLRKATDEQMYSVIARGSASLGRSSLCPPWGKVLKEEEIRDIIAYVRSLGSKTR